MTKEEILERLKTDEDYYGDFGKQFLSNSNISTLLSNPSLLGEQQARITSYNVCYTKLLRYFML